MKLEFCRQIFEKTHLQNFIKICLVVAELFHAERQTDGLMDGHDEAKSRFRNSANAPKI